MQLVVRKDCFKAFCRGFIDQGQFGFYGIKSSFGIFVGPF